MLSDSCAAILMSQSECCLITQPISGALDLAVLILIRFGIPKFVYSFSLLQKASQHYYSKVIQLTYFANHMLIGLVIIKKIQLAHVLVCLPFFVLWLEEMHVW